MLNIRHIPHLKEFQINIQIYLKKKITPHGFRHSHVSLLIHLGFDIYEFADRFGDKPREVEKTYYHMFPEKKKVQQMLLINKKNKRKKVWYNKTLDLQGLNTNWWSIAGSNR